jgi:hypothetical protein
MSCKKDLKPCDPDSPICRLTNEADACFYDQESGQKRVFFNRVCSNFKKKEAP